MGKMRKIWKFLNIMKLGTFILQVLKLDFNNISMLFSNLASDSLKIKQFVMFSDCLNQYFEAEFLKKISLKIPISGIILKTFTHAPLDSRLIMHEP